MYDEIKLKYVHSVAENRRDSVSNPILCRVLPLPTEARDSLVGMVEKAFVLGEGKVHQLQTIGTLFD